MLRTGISAAILKMDCMLMTHINQKMQPYVKIFAFHYIRGA